MVDQRALDFGFQALDRATADGEHELDAFRKGIEAYEEERRDGKQFLVWLKANAYPKLHLLHWDAYDREFHDVTGMCWSEHGDVINGAMFRTIDPPTQDADSRATQPTKNERG